MTRKLLSTACIVAIVTMHPIGLALAEDPMPAKNLLAQQGPDLWRGSKLVGVNVYGPDSKKIGDVSDVLMSHDGKAAYVIVGVGGFLGIGEKDIAIPFDQVAWTDQPLRPNPGAAAVPATNGAAGGGMAPATATGLGSPADMTGNQTAPVTGATTGATAGQPPEVQRSTAYPDHGLVSLTADQLKQAPAFQYTR